jgi:thiosulfate/3-mercaptopyruvate sulfurtransferase
MTRKTGWMMLAILFVLSPLSAAFGAWTNPDLLYSVAQAEKIVGDSNWVILGQEVYEKGHIPGAIVLGKKSAKNFLRDGSARTFQDPGKYEKILGEAGIGNATRVLVYSDMKHKLMDDAFITFWLLEYLGHTDVHLLDGGFDAWTRAGKPVETAVARREPAVFKAQPKKSAFATAERQQRHPTGGLPHQGGVRGLRHPRPARRAHPQHLQERLACDLFRAEKG